MNKIFVYTFSIVDFNVIEKYDFQSRQSFQDISYIAAQIHEMCLKSPENIYLIDKGAVYNAASNGFLRIENHQLFYIEYKRDAPNHEILHKIANINRFILDLNT